MITETPVRITLAAALRGAEINLRTVERRVEDYLTTLFQSWRGWVFTAPDGIDVYEAQDSARSAALLHRQGFATVTIHGHPASRSLTCTCPVHEMRDEVR